MTYTCPVCKRETPPERIQYKTTRGKRKPKCCKPCNVARMLEWKEKNRDKWRAAQRLHQKRRARRAVLYREVVERNTSELPLDVMRRYLAERPSDMSETEAAAYFRGYVAGAKRTEFESERFDRLSDLCHRIAAEVSKPNKVGRFQDYGDNLSVAYEGLLAFVRRSYHAENPEHERKMAAKAIRNAIIDYARGFGPGKRSGESRYETKMIPKDSEGEYINLPESHDAQHPMEFADALDSVELDPKDRKILEMLGSGMLYWEIGEKLGITESRVGQRLRELRERQGGPLLAALQGV